MIYSGISSLDFRRTAVIQPRLQLPAKTAVAALSIFLCSQAQPQDILFSIQEEDKSGHKTFAIQVFETGQVSIDWNAVERCSGRGAGPSITEFAGLTFCSLARDHRCRPF